MIDVGVVLVHGYLGSPEDLRSVTDPLREMLGPDAVTAVTLPGHGPGRTPPFATQQFMDEILREARALAPRTVVLVGHSVGGTLALAAAASLEKPPALVVLAGTPPRIDVAYAERWSHATETAGPDLADVAALVRLVNHVARGPRHPSPLLVLQGDDDALVPADEAERWRERSAMVRLARLPAGAHDLFQGAAATRAVDTVLRAIADVRRGPIEEKETAQWLARAPALAPRVAHWPAAVHHVRGAPAGRALDGLPPEVGEVAPDEPTILNVGVTTRCDLACQACARTLGRVQPQDMPIEAFARVLDAVPHAARVVLVGLGEPLLHPRVVDLVELAARDGRHVSMVTNGMRLDRAMTRALFDAGLRALTVSLDAVSPAAAARVRRGTDVARVLANLGAASALRDQVEARRVSLSVFTAVAADTLDEFPRVLETVRALGVDAVMATDLNFSENAERSLRQSASAEALARLDGALRESLASGLPVLSVSGLEVLALPERYREFLVLRGRTLTTRRPGKTRCHSPWQTLPVDASGDATLCDCQPRAKLGNLLRDPLSSVWNGEAARAHRRAMHSDDPPAACRGCPRA